MLVIKGGLKLMVLCFVFGYMCTKNINFLLKKFVFGACFLCLSIFFCVQMRLSSCAVYVAAV